MIIANIAGLMQSLVWAPHVIDVTWYRASSATP